MVFIINSRRYHKLRVQSLNKKNQRKHKLYVCLCMCHYVEHVFISHLFSIAIIFNFISFANSVFLIHHSNTITKLIYFRMLNVVLNWTMCWHVRILCLRNQFIWNYGDHHYLPYVRKLFHQKLQKEPYFC